VPHRALSNYVQWALDTYRPRSAVVSSSLSFDATITSLLMPLLSGASVELLREGQEIDGLYAALQADAEPRLVKLTPAHLDVMGRRAVAEGAVIPPALFVIGGEALSAATVTLWQGLNAAHRLVNEYGPTENVVGCITYEVPAPFAEPLVPIGRPVANTRAYVLDAVGAPVPVGVLGELYLGGAQVTRGYLNRPALTADRFAPDPFGQPGARLYRTGDVARWRADGVLEYVGRTDFQVKVRGFRIELGEIEAQLRECRGVRHAVAVVREDAPGEKRLVAYVVAEPSAEREVPSAELLRARLAERLPEHMVPSAFVRLDALPLSPNGKLDRRGLPAPEGGAYLRREYEPPQGETEEALAELWSEVLGVDHVSRHDHFFELGGHSLSAVKLMTRIRRHMGAEIELHDIFRAPTLAAMTRCVLLSRLNQFDPEMVAQLAAQLDGDETVI
jgi:acyl-coenzyme A synthetase/AMP-(fatty) acid ligase/acyl carrier protein